MDKILALQTLIEPVIEGLDLELVDMQYIKEGDHWYLRIFIDKPEGIAHSDCAEVSEALDSLLDESDLLKGAYILEVSSPGVERPLKKEKDYIRFIGKEILLKTIQPVNNQKTFRGKLSAFKDDTVYLDLGDGRMLEILYNNISKANLEVEF